MHRRHLHALGAVAATAAVALLATACAAGTPAADADAPAAPRLAVGVEGGVVVLDGSTLETVGSADTESFVRLNAAGDGQHVLVTTSRGFQVLDTAAAQLTDLVFDAQTAGHVVRHGGKTVLYDDGTSDTTIFETSALRDAQALPETEVVPGVSAHHGVSIELEDGTFLTTVGDADGRTGIRVLDKNRTEVQRSDECPGVHGEGTAADEAVIFGCENGALMYHDGEIVKFEAPAEYGRMGNAFVSESSPIVVGDYKDAPDAEGYLLTRVTLIDTAERTYEVVDLPDGVEYTFRGVVRGPEEKAYILSTDGAIHVLDPETGEITASHAVIDAWEGPAQWQDPHPTIVSDGETAYVTEPAKNTVYAVDLATGAVRASATLDGTPNELAIALG